MKIVFGLSLDSRSYPSMVASREALTGELRCGPLALLQTLETRLGLTGAWEPEPYRIEIYRQRLLAADDGNRFYSRSLKADSQGVAQTLLCWRDELLMSGWDFATETSMTARLKDLAEVEAVPNTVAPMVPWGISERFRAVMLKLPCSSLEISELQLAVSRSLLDAHWNNLMDGLSASGVIIRECEALNAKSVGDLGALKDALHRGKCIKANGDGSLLVLRGSSESELADLLSTWQLSSINDGRLFIVPSDDRSLERVLTESGTSPLGISTYSPLRPILQILPLLCELLWEPLDPYRLLELLSLPLSPIPSIAARKLAEAVASAPGIGGKAWQSALEEIEEIILSDIDKGPERLKWIQENINIWLGGDRFPIATGVPHQALADLGKRVAAWAGRLELNGADEDFQLKALAAQAAHIARLAQEAPEPTITQPQMRKLLKMVVGEGQALGERAGAGHPHWVTTPEAILAPVSELVWFGFTRSKAPGYRRAPWLNKELTFLESRGVRLPCPDLELNRHVRGYERAVYSAVDRLILCIPEIENGTAAESHPFFDRLSVILGDSLRTIEVNTEKWLANDDRLDPLPTVPVEFRNIPVPKRFWKLPHQVSINNRDTESYSSLEILFDEPYKWIFGYLARLRKGTIQSIGSRNTIMGNLSHRLFEELFVKGEDCSSWTQSVVERRVDDLVKVLIPTEGAIFLLPGYVAEFQTLVRKLKRAAWAMAGHIKENGWKVVGTECGVDGLLGAQPVEGSVDLLLEKTGGILSVVDLKWGKSKYLRAKLLENRAIQLAIYAHMLKSGKKMPHVAYFSFSEALLIAPDQNGFKSARIAEIPQGESLASLVSSMEKTFAFRRSQFDLNRIEVPVEGTVPDATVVIPDNVLVDTEYVSNPAEYLALVGWEDGNRA